MSRRGKSRQHRWSTAQPTVYRGARAVVKPEPDTRTTEYGGIGKQGKVTCPACGYEVTIKRAEWSDVENGIVHRKTLLISNHRPEGGKFSARRGDPLCLGSGTVAG